MVHAVTSAEIWAGPITWADVVGVDQLYRFSSLVDDPIAIDSAASAGQAARAYNRAPFTAEEIRESDSVYNHRGRWNVAGRYVAALILAAATDKPRGDRVQRSLMADEARLNDQVVKRELEAAEVIPGWYEVHRGPQSTGGVHLVNVTNVSEVFVTGPHAWGNDNEQAFWVGTGSPASPVLLAMGPYGNAVVANVIAEAVMHQVIALRSAGDR
jgi:hypothetical protein